MLTSKYSNSNLKNVGRFSYAIYGSANAATPWLARRAALNSIRPPPTPNISSTPGNGPGPEKEETVDYRINAYLITQNSNV